MRLFKRVGDIIAANLNDMVDQFEDPETMLRQAIREMETTVAQATGAAAKAIAGETLLAKELAGHVAEAERWRARAVDAVAAGDDDLARRALARKHEHETLVHALRDQHDAARDASASVRRQVEAMKAKLAEARRKLATLTARQRAADARKKLQGIAADRPFESNGFDTFERMRGRVDLAEAEADALVTLHGGAGEELREQFAEDERRRQVEDELGAIKESIRASSRPA